MFDVVVSVLFPWEPNNIETSAKVPMTFPFSDVIVKVPQVVFSLYIL